MPNKIKVCFNVNIFKIKNIILFFIKKLNHK